SPRCAGAFRSPICVNRSSSLLARVSRPPPGGFAAHADHIRRIPSEPDYNPWMHQDGRSERDFFGSAFCILDAYSMLQVLGGEGCNADAELVWHYGALVDSGWEEEASFVAGAPRGRRVLVATKGASD